MVGGIIFLYLHQTGRKVFPVSEIESFTRSEIVIDAVNCLRHLPREVL